MPHMPRSKRNARNPSPPDAIRAVVIGGGAREHALVWRLHKSASVKAVFTTHADNPGIKALAQPLDFEFSIREVYRLEQFIRREKINLVVVGPEQPLAEGVVDKLAKVAAETGCRVFGPTADAARLEADKGFAKKVLRAAAAPTAEGRVFKDPQGAIEFLETRERPYVVKAVGLAAGKGVIVPDSLEEAVAAVRTVMEEKRFGDAGREVLLEERMDGPEVSAFALVDGANVVLLDACQDHKRLLEDDQGPNTGGMGAYCPAPRELFGPEQFDFVSRKIVVPVVDALKRDDVEFRGVLYVGLMLTQAGPRVLEFNVRFGDPECQCLMRRVTGDVGRLLWHCADGSLDQADFGFADQAVVCTVLAAEGYPDKPVKGAEITGLDDAADMPGVEIFHAGTIRKDGKLLTNGGRVLSVTATGDTVAHARERANAACERIHFHGMQWRRDIAHQAITAGPAHA